MGAISAEKFFATKIVAALRTTVKPGNLILLYCGKMTARN
jgi:hypothetical protein